MSTTPRTDAEEGYVTSEHAVRAGFARTLELENRELRERLAQQIDYWLKIGDRFHAEHECRASDEAVAHLRDFATPLDVSKL